MAEKLPTRQVVFPHVGEGREARGGEPRQQVILDCEPGDPVDLQREPSNPHDANAILVCRGSQDIGFLPREAAATLAPSLDEGRQHTAQIHRLTGGVPSYPSYGVEISIVWDGRPSPEPHPLDETQLRSRRGKRASAGR